MKIRGFSYYGLVNKFEHSVLEITYECSKGVESIVKTDELWEKTKSIVSANSNYINRIISQKHLLFSTNFAVNSLSPTTKREVPKNIIELLKAYIDFYTSYKASNTNFKSEEYYKHRENLREFLNREGIKPSNFRNYVEFLYEEYLSKN